MKYKWSTRRSNSQQVYKRRVGR